LTSTQLQLNLWQQLQQAQTEPQATDWRQLCLAFDEAIDRTPVGQRLATAADAIEQMADVFAARADKFFSGWLWTRQATFWCLGLQELAKLIFVPHGGAP
jgi:hypothetical protein